MPSVSAQWPVLLAVSGLLLAGAVSGCATTQEKAAMKQAESKLILEKREAKRAQRKKEHR